MLWQNVWIIVIFCNVGTSMTSESKYDPTGSNAMNIWHRTTMQSFERPSGHTYIGLTEWMRLAKGCEGTIILAFDRKFTNLKTQKTFSKLVLILLAVFRETCVNCLWVEDSVVQLHIKGLLLVTFLYSSWGSSVFEGHKLRTNWLSLCTYVTYSKRLPALDGVHMQMNAQAVWLLLLCFRQHITVLSVQCTYEMTYYLPGYEMTMELIRSLQIFHLGNGCLVFLSKANIEDFILNFNGALLCM